MNYFWVNVGVSYDEVINNQFLWAPIPYTNSKGRKQTSAGWLNVPTIEAGDIIFCNKDKQIIAIAVATKNAYSSPRPKSRDFDHWKNEGYRVDVDITLMEPKVDTTKFIHDFIAQFNTRTEPLLLNKDNNFCEQYSVSLPHDAGEYLLNQCDQDIQAISIESQEYAKINSGYPRESGKSWVIHSQFVARKVVDKSLVTDHTTGVPKDMVSFFTNHDFDLINNIEIPFLIGKKQYQVTLLQNKTGRHVLKLGKVKDNLNLTSLEVGKDSLWFEFVDGVFCVYTTCKKSKNAIKPSLTKPTGSTSVGVKSKGRIGQDYFKQEVSRICKGKCIVTDVTDTYPNSILIASHIKAWKYSNDDERLDGNNGLLLAPHIDKLFDKYLISFSDEKKILASKKLDENILKAWNIDIEKEYKLTAKHLEYMKYHRRKFRSIEHSKV